MTLLIRAPGSPADKTIFEMPYHWRHAAHSTNRQVLENFVRDMPLEMFHRWKRVYRILENAT